MAKLPTWIPMPKLSLGTKAVLLAGILVTLAAASVVLAAYQTLSGSFEERARANVEVNLRTLSLTFAEAFPEAKITLDHGNVVRVDMSAMPTFKDHTIVDRAVSYVGGNATIFVRDPNTDQFVRRTTNLKKENGDRAVGTQLAADHPGQAVLRRGEPYKGPALLFGTKYYTVYQPVFDANHHTIGILYVGTETAH